MTVGHHLHQIGIGGRYNPYIRFDQLVVAHPFKLFVLQNPKQFDLQ
jgi:hypothetical protein